MSDAQAGDRAVPAASRAALTPAMRQYAQQKAQVPDAILLFRMGDFYEMFYEDAKLAAGLLGLTLTSRSKGDDAIPLAGIPYHALESYLAKLVQAGHKVAISEQVEDPRQARGVVRRAIVRIITPGTLTDEALLETGSSNYLAAVCRQGRDCGLACLELSAGEFWVQSCPPEQVIDELVRLRPSELLVAEAPIDQADPVVEQYRQLVGGAVSQRPAHSFDPYQAERIIHRHFGVSTLAGFGFERMDAGLCAAGAVLDYLAETQKTAASHITAIRRRDQAETLQLDQATYRSLEIEQPIRDQDRRACLLAAIDRTVTAMGRR
ncbi:MAG: DNA mismatch repair protein MutS, partial [Phycisphaerae bacterium]